MNIFWQEKVQYTRIHDKHNLLATHRLAPEQLKPVNGLDKLCKWIEERGLKRAAVTNAPKESAELIISMLGLDDFFKLIVLGSECDRAKPFPDPYLKALEHLKVAREHAFVVEVRLRIALNHLVHKINYVLLGYF